MLKTLKIQTNGKRIAKKSVFAMKKVLIHKNLKIATLRPIYVNKERFSLCPMKIHHAISEKGYDKLIFLKML